MLDMYYEGECSDFRYTYNAQTPSLTELKAFLESTKTPPPPAAESHQVSRHEALRHFPPSDGV